MKIICCAIMLLLTSCASYSPGQDATIERLTSNEILGLSAKVDDTMTYKDLVFVNFYLFNPTNNWVRVKSAELIDIEDHPDLRVIVGKDLYYWAKSMEHKVAIDNYNREMLLGSLAIGGAALAISSNNASAARLGTALTVGSVLLSDVENLLEKISTLERASLVPEDHIYSPFSVPPKLVTRKWVLFQKMNVKRLCRLKLKLTYIDGTMTVFGSELTTLRHLCGNDE